MDMPFHRAQRRSKRSVIFFCPCTVIEQPIVQEILGLKPRHIACAHGGFISSQSSSPL